MRPANTPLLTDLLREVSRSFYLTLRWLPGAVRPQIGLAYLLARATDTIADTELIPVPQRLEALAALRERILGTTTQPVAFPALAQRQDAAAERQLLERIEDAIAILTTLSAEDQQRIRDVLQTIVGGQELDLRRFSGASASAIVALGQDDELDDYTYRVAGCVGEFWTGMCREHLFPRAPLDDARLLADGVRFGKGLQLVNILRDLPADLRQGRCYLPEPELGKYGLKPSDLLQTEAESKFRPYYESLLSRAEDHLRAGWAYTNQLPRGCVRVRLVCAWPILIGVQTLARLRQQKILDASQRIRISRADVRGIVLRTLIAYPLRGAWDNLFVRAASR